MRQIFKVWNLTLIIITFMLTLLGTMMTRSGIVQSVHAFAQSDIGTYFFGFLRSLPLALASSSSGGEFRAIARPRSIPEPRVRVCQQLILLAAAFFVTFATMFPSITSSSKARRSTSALRSSTCDG